MTTGIAQIQKTTIGGVIIDINVLTAFQGDEVFVQTKPIDFGTQFDKELEMLKFDITGRGNLTDLQCYVGYGQYLNDTFTLAGPFSLSGQDTTLWLPRDRTDPNYVPQARWFTLKVEDLLPAVTWKLSYIEAYGKIVNSQTGRGPRGRW